MNAKIRYGLSAAVLALIGAGASAPEILDQFLDEKEGNHTTAYRDGAGIWTICRGACVFRSIRSRIGIEVRSAIRIHSINRELNFFYRFLTRFFAAFHYRGIFPQ